MRWIDRVLVACAVLVVALSAMPLGARLSWVLELATHFRVQYLAVTTVVLALLALRRQWTACAALVVAGAISAAPVLPYLPLKLATPTAATAPIKVLTVNVSFRAQFSARRLLEIVRETEPDIVVVQELTPHAERELMDLDVELPNFRKFTADGPIGIGLWSRHELVSGGTVALGRAPAIDALVRGPSGVFRIIGVHLRAPTAPQRAAERNRQLRELAVRSAAVSEPLVVAGDFNVTPYSPFYTDWLETSGLEDSRRGRTLSMSWPTLLPAAGIPIDHVAVNQHFEILSHRNLPDFESDHYAVLVEVALRSPSKVEP